MLDDQLNVFCRNADVAVRMATALRAPGEVLMSGAVRFWHLRKYTPVVQDSPVAFQQGNPMTSIVYAVQHSGPVLDPMTSANVREAESLPCISGSASEVVSCATKDSIADARRAADATGPRNVT